MLFSTIMYNYVATSYIAIMQLISVHADMHSMQIIVNI